MVKNIETFHFCFATRLLAVVVKDDHFVGIQELFQEQQRLHYYFKIYQMMLWFLYCLQQLLSVRTRSACFEVVYWGVDLGH